MFFEVLDKSFCEQLMSLGLNSHEDVACSNILSSSPVTLMFLQEKSRNEACFYYEPIWNIPFTNEPPRHWKPLTSLPVSNWLWNQIFGDKCKIQHKRGRGKRWVLRSRVFLVHHLWGFLTSCGTCSPSCAPGSPVWLYLESYCKIQHFLFSGIVFKMGVNSGLLLLQQTVALEFCALLF